MTGYSTPHGPAALHPDNCHCPACVDVAINAEDSESINGTTYHGVPLSNEREMQRAATLADAMIDKRNEWLNHISDQYEDMRDWLWSRGQID